MPPNQKIGLQAILEDAGFRAGVRNYLNSLNQMTSSTRKASGLLSGGFTGLIGTMTSLGAVTTGLAVGGIGALITGLVGLAGASVQSAITFQSAFAGVTKVFFDLADAEGKLTQQGETLAFGIRQLSKQVPFTPEQLANIAELGGQLGIAEKDVLTFTSVIARLSAVTELTTTQAATKFAQLANIMQIPSAQFEAMASSVVALGKAGASTEPQILNFALRIAAAGQIAKFTAPEVLAIGSAMASVGIQSERGGTAVQKVILKINDAVATGSGKLNIFAQVAGMSAKDFATAWRQDAGQAFTKFVEGLGKQGDKAAQTLRDLDLNDQRLIQSFLSLSAAGDLLSTHIATATQAWKENTQLQQTAQQRFATTASQISILRNQIRDLGITIGNILLPPFNSFLQLLTGQVLPVLDALAKFLAFSAQGSNLATEAFARIPPALEPVALGLRNLLFAMREIAKGDFGDAIRLLFPPDAAARVIAFAAQVQDFVNKTIIPFIQNNGPAFQGALKGILALFGASSVIFTFAVALSVLTNPITLLIAAAGLLGAAWQTNFGNIQGITAGVVAWFQTNFPQIQTTVETVVGGISAWVSANAPGIAAGFMGVVTTIRTTWDAEWPKLRSTVELVIGGIKSWLDANVPGILATFQTMLGQLKDKFDTNFAYLQPIVQTAIQNVTNWLTTNGPSMASGIQAGVTAIVAKFNELGPQLLTAVQTAYNQAMGWLSANAPNLATAIRGAGQVGQGALTFSLPTIGGGLEKTLTGLSGAFSTVMNTIQSAITTVTPFFTALATGIQTALVQPISNFITVMTHTEAFNSFITNIQALGQSLLAFGQAVAPVLVAAFTLIVGLITSVVSAVITALGPFIEHIMFVVNDVIQVFTGLFTFLAGIFNLIVGIFTLNGSKITLALQQIPDGINKIFGGLGKIIVDLITGAFATVDALIDGFILGIIKFFTGLYNSLIGHSIIPDIVNGAITLFTTLSDTGKRLIQELADGIIRIISGIQTTWDTIWNGFKTTVETVVGGIQKTIETIMGTIGGLITDALGKAGELFNKLFGGGGQAAQAGITPVQNLSPELLAALQAQMQALQESWNALWPTLVNAAIMAMNQILTVVTNTMTLISMAMATQLLAMQTGWQTWLIQFQLDFINTFQVWLIPFWEHTWQAIFAILFVWGDQIVTLAQSIAYGIVGAFLTITWEDVGKAIASGIAAGIRNNAGLIAAAAVAAAWAAYNAALAALNSGGSGGSGGKGTGTGAGSGSAPVDRSPIAQPRFVLPVIPAQPVQISVPLGARMLGATTTTSINNVTQVTMDAHYANYQSPSNVYYDLRAALAAAKA